MHLIKYLKRHDCEYTMHPDQIQIIFHYYSALYLQKWFSDAADMNYSILILICSLQWPACRYR